MAERDPFEDDEYDEEAEAKIRAVMAPLQVTKEEAAPPRVGRRKGETDEMLAEKADRIAWETTLPKTSDEAKFLGNLGLRLLKGIQTATINKMSIKERVNASSSLFAMRQLLLDKPIVSYDFAERQNVQAVLAKAQAELERRERERMTVDVTPQAGSNHST